MGEEGGSDLGCVHNSDSEAERDELSDLRSYELTA